MQRKLLVGLMSAVALLTVMVVQADVTSSPVPAGALRLKRLMTLPDSGSVYNPRMFNGEVFGTEISNPESIGRFLPEQTTPTVGVVVSPQARMLSPMGGNSTDWVIASGGGSSGTDYFSRFDYTTLNNRVLDTNVAIKANAFDWVDENTVIASSHESAFRNRLHLVDLTADPFSASLNTNWNENGYVETSAARIRAVSVGDTYSEYAYFGDNSVNTNAGLYAIKLDDAAMIPLGVLTVSPESTKLGIWTVKELGGYLYVQTSDDGIYVYNMTDATTLGSLVTHHAKAQLEALTSDAPEGNYTENFGFDVVDDGQTILLGVGDTAIAELAPVAQRPTLVWSTMAPTSGNFYYGGGVKDHQYYTGKLVDPDGGPQVWDAVGNLVAATNNGYQAKCAVPIGPYVFFTSNSGGFYRINDDWETDFVDTIVNPNGTNPEAGTTDGTYLYTNSDANEPVVYKYAISNFVGGFTLTEVWASTTGVGRVRALSHHNGKIYAADYNEDNVLEIDAETGDSTILFALPAGSQSHQVVRSGDRIYVVGRDGNLQIYATDGSTWSSVGTYLLGHNALYGMSDVDDGNIWVGAQGVSKQPTMTYWSLRSFPFTDDFESYAVNQSLSDIAYNGWSGSVEAAVTNGVGVDGSQAARLPGGSVVTNSVGSSVTLTKAWTDMQVKPVKVENVEPMMHSDASVMLYVNGDGYAVVYDSNAMAWDVCSNSVADASVAPIADDTYARITLYQDYVAQTVAVFVNDVLVREALPMINKTLSSYEMMSVRNFEGDDVAYLDNVRIATNYPVDLTGDSDGDGVPDAQEIAESGSIFTNDPVPDPFADWMAAHGLTDPDGDEDGDNFTNAEEYLAGTNPLDAESVFQILNIEQVDNTVVITIMGNDSGAQVPYVIERSTDLTVGFTSYGSAERAEAPANTVYVDETPVDGVAFYRINASDVE